MLTFSAADEEKEKKRMKQKTTKMCASWLEVSYKTRPIHNKEQHKAKKQKEDFKLVFFLQVVGRHKNKLKFTASASPQSSIFIMTAINMSKKPANIKELLPSDKVTLGLKCGKFRNYCRNNYQSLARNWEEQDVWLGNNSKLSRRQVKNQKSQLKLFCFLVDDKKLLKNFNLRPLGFPTDNKNFHSVPQLNTWEKTFSFDGKV